MTYTCSVCGDTYGETIPATGHVASLTWEYDENGHWHVCTVCGAKLTCYDHVFDFVVDKNATATEDGYGHYECECGYSYGKVTIPATGEELDDVPNTGDISGMGFGIAAVVVAMCSTAAVVIKRKYTA